MPKIVSVNSRTSKKNTGGNIFQQVWEWFFSLDKFWRSVFTAMLCIIFATPIITSTYLTFFNHAASSTYNFYVSPLGNDSYDGSINFPWHTLSHAATMMGTLPVTAGYVVHVAPGTYTDQITTTATGAVYSPITYVSDVKWGAKISTTGVDSAWINTGNNVVIDGFDITGQDNVSQTSNFIRMGIVNYGSNVIIRNNRIHDIAGKGCVTNGGAGIDNAGYFATNDQVENNLVFTIGTNGCARMQGIYSTNSHGLITNNIVYGISGAGIQVWNVGTNMTVTNNLLFYNNNSGLIIGAGDAPNYATASANFNIINNNIIVDNVGYGIQATGTLGANNMYSNNIFYNNSLGGFRNYENQIDTSSITTVAPRQLFVNYQIYGGGDYHLIAGSKAIDSAVSQGAPATDFDGIPRYQGTAYDIGPYEWYDPSVFSPTPTPTPNAWWNSTPTLTRIPIDTQVPTTASTQQAPTPFVYPQQPVLPNNTVVQVTYVPQNSYNPNPNEYDRPNDSSPVTYPTLAVEQQNSVSSNRSIFGEVMSFVLSINNTISGSVKNIVYTLIHISLKR